MQTFTRAGADAKRGKLTVGTEGSTLRSLSNKKTPAHLDNINARVEVDGAFGFFAVLLILVGVEDVGAVWELRQVEEPPFEYLQGTAV